MKTIDIAELSQQTGLPASTLRYYEEQSLISAIGRRGLRRLFDTCVFQRLALVALGKSAGFSLSEIAAFLLSNHTSSIDRGALRAKADEIDRQIHVLQQVRDGLLHVAKCPEPSHLECPKFQKMMRIAAKKQARAVKH
jgi:DNA-binding transcriptional MerR regulator